ncbi:hypothetical protein CBL_06109 [Carabus blaptoides fortunei]
MAFHQNPSTGFTVRRYSILRPSQGFPHIVLGPFYEAAAADVTIAVGWVTIGTLKMKTIRQTVAEQTCALDVRDPILRDIHHKDMYSCKRKHTERKVRKRECEKCKLCAKEEMCSGRAEMEGRRNGRTAPPEVVR